MDDDWQPGDLALCIKMGPWHDEEGGLTGGGPSAGAVYEVADLDFEDGPLHLAFEQWPDESWLALRFRKIRPHTPDEEDAETIRLLTGRPVMVPSHA